LSTCGFLLVTSSCLKPIIARSIRFSNVSKGNEQNTQNRGENINLGGVLQHWAHLGPSESFYMKQLAHLGELSSPGRACYFWLKPPTRLGELGNKLLPYFGYKRASKAEGKGFSTIGKHISLKISENMEKEEENQGGGTSVMLP